MANTMTLIASYTAAGSVASIDFSSIPATYTDLYLLISTRVSDTGSGDDAVIAQFNADTAANYSDIVLYGGGSSSTGSYTETSFRAGYSSGQSQTANTFGNSSCYIPNYAGSNQKSGSTDWADEDNSSSTSYRGLAAAKWTGTAAINAIKLKSITGKTFAQYSTAYLDGVKNA